MTVQDLEIAMSRKCYTRNTALSERLADQWWSEVLAGGQVPFTVMFMIEDAVMRQDVAEDPKELWLY